MDIDIMSLTETKKNGPGIEEIHNYIHIYSRIPKEERAKKSCLSIYKKKV